MLTDLSALSMSPYEKQENPLNEEIDREKARGKPDAPVHAFRFPQRDRIDQDKQEQDGRRKEINGECDIESTFYDAAQRLDLVERDTIGQGKQDRVQQGEEP